MVVTLDHIVIKRINWSSTGKYVFAEDTNTNIWKYDPASSLFKLMWRAKKPSQSSRFLTPSETDDDVFYFVSDHRSDFKQIYKYDHGKTSEIIHSNFDKLQLKRPVKNGYIYYRTNDSLIARHYISKYEIEISHYIELSGLGDSDFTFKIPTMFIYGENDNVINSRRRKMMDRQVKYFDGQETRLKAEFRNIIGRDNVFLTIKTVNKFNEQNFSGIKYEAK